MKLFEFLKSKGYDISDTEFMKPYIKQWLEWYKGDIPSFQRYYIYNGNKKVYFTRKTLNLPKKLSEDFANFLLNEKVDYTIGSNKTTDAFYKLLESIKFERIANRGIEKTFALGTGAFVLNIKDLKYNEAEQTVYADEEAKLTFDFIQADKLIPLSYDGDDVTECAFVNYKTMAKQKFMFLSIHRIATEEDEYPTGNYIIENYVFLVDKAGNITDVTDNRLEDALKTFDTGSDTKWFSVLTPNVTNNLCDNSPFGISIYANSLDIIKGVDIAYDSLVNEFILGRKRIFVKSDLMQPDTESGEMKFVFDPNESVYHQLPVGASNEPDVKENDFNLRIAEHENGIQLQLNLLSSNLGMGATHYRFDNGALTTATQVISENSDLYRTINKHEILLREKLLEVFNAIIYIANTYLKGYSIQGDVAIDFDDSIIEDTEKNRNKSLIEYNTGLISAEQYFVETRDMTTKQAKKFVADMQEQRIAEQPELEQEPEEEE